MAEDVRRHRFGPLERRGLVGSLRPGQVVVLAASLTTGVLLLRLLPSGVGALAAIGLVLASLAFFSLLGFEWWRLVASTGRSGSPTETRNSAADGRSSGSSIEISTTSVSGWLALSLRATSMPSSPGIRTSSSTS